MNQQEKDATTNLIEQVQDSAINIIQPVLERTMVLAAEYATACGRDMVLGEDMEYAMKYCAMNEVGKKMGTHFPEIYEESSDEEDQEKTSNLKMKKFLLRDTQDVNINSLK